MDVYREVMAGRQVTVSVADLREDIARGQSVAAYGSRAGGKSWQVLSRGTTIGYRKLDRIEPASVSAVRLTIEDAIGEPEPVGIALYA